MSQHTVQSILLHFSHLFILCKFLGIYPHNLNIFKEYAELKKSKIGTIYIIITMIVIIVFYNLLIYSLPEEGNSMKTSQNTLTYIIAIFLTYIGLVMMCIDQLIAIRNQESLGQLYDRIRMVDERLSAEGCWIDDTNLRKNITNMVALVFVFEITILLSTYILLVDYTKWKSLLWIFSSFPTLYNSFDKIWFAVTINALKQRFVAINKALNDMVEEHERWKKSSSDRHGVHHEDDLIFLHTELATAATDIIKYKKGKNRIIPVVAAEQSLNKFNDLSAKMNANANITRDSQLNNLVKVGEKLNNFGQLHDELCEIGNLLNELWGYPILVLMAHGFVIFTAQLYFLYCFTQNQDIPSLFLSAKNAFITVLLLTYTSGKCIYLIYISWKTCLKAQCTGIYLHKCGIVKDNNDLYQIVNYLSLKLLNHSVDFSAGGFFSLNMETLYAVSGGISSYLIILIQFNLAAEQAKDIIRNYVDNLSKGKT